MDTLPKIIAMKKGFKEQFPLSSLSLAITIILQVLIARPQNPHACP